MLDSGQPCFTHIFNLILYQFINFYASFPVLQSLSHHPSAPNLQPSVLCYPSSPSIHVPSISYPQSPAFTQPPVSQPQTRSSTYSPAPCHYPLSAVSRLRLVARGRWRVAARCGLLRAAGCAPCAWCAPRRRWRGLGEGIRQIQTRYQAHARAKVAQHTHVLAYERMESCLSTPEPSGVRLVPVAVKCR